MKETLAKILGITIVVILIMQSVTAFAISEKEQLENEKSKIDDQLEEAKEKAQELEAKKSAAMKSVEDLISKISDSEDAIELLKSKVMDLQAKIKAKERDIQQKEIEYNEQEKLLDARLIAIYEKGDTSYLDVLLTSTSMTEFLSNYYAATELVECDKELIRTTKEQKAKIEAEKAELEANKKELDASIVEQKQKSAELSKMKKEKETQVANLSQEEKEAQKEVEELQAANRRIANEIREAEIRYQKQLEELEKQQGESGKGAGSGYFMRPVSSGTITATAYYSSSKKFHGAVDYGVSSGTPVYAAADGVVMSTANLSTSYGTYVVIRHANGLQSYYAHGTPGSISVRAGQIVKKGEKIMLSGNSGHSTGPHLHFEVRKSPYNYNYNATAYGQDSRVDPLNYL